MPKIPAAPVDPNIGARLKRVRHKLGLTGEEIARRLDLSRPYWSALENGRRAPGRKLLSALERVFGVRAEYVADGSGAMFLRGTSPSQQVDTTAGPRRPEAPLIASESAPSWADAPGGRLMLTLSSGPSAARHYEVIPRLAANTLDPAGDLAFSREWLRLNLGHANGALASLQVRGDAMQPALHDGDTVIVDLGVQRVDASGLYVIALHGDRQVRRIQRLLDNSLLILSDNPAYGKEAISAARAKSLEVTGRVIWPRLA